MLNSLVRRREKLFSPTCFSSKLTRLRTSYFTQIKLTKGIPMNVLAGKSDKSIQAETDTLGGRQLLDSNVYLAEIKLAYFTESKNGATGLNCTFIIDPEGQKKEYNETLWCTNRSGETFYTNSQGEKKYLAGYLHADALALLTVGESIGDLATEEKIVKVYNSEAKSEVPTKVDAVTPLMGQRIKLAITKQTVNQNKLNEATEKYEPTAETRDENSIQKVFSAENDMTTAEIRAEAEAPGFMHSWLDKYAGQVVNRVKEVAQGARSGSPRTGAGAGASRPKSSLFGKK